MKAGFIIAALMLATTPALASYTECAVAKETLLLNRPSGSPESTGNACPRTSTLKKHQRAAEALSRAGWSWQWRMVTCGHHRQTARMQPTATMQPSAKRKAPVENNQVSALRR
jgi:hypothetical protein